jgi:hypothetical protein
MACSTHEREIHIVFRQESVQERDNLENPDVDTEGNIKMDVNK